MNIPLIFLIIWLFEDRFLQYILCHRLPQTGIQGSKNHLRGTNEIDNIWLKNLATYNINTHESYETRNSKKTKHSIVKDTNTKSNGSFPSLIDVAPLANITANATCGTTYPGSDETFCKLGGSSQCSVCSDTVTDKKHSIAYAVDGDLSNWWQSPSLEQGSQYEYVTITMDLQQEYYIWYVIIKCAISPRPANWILERSIDGTHFSPWQYFVANEEDCWQRYGLLATTSAAANTVPADNETLCSTFYSKIKPLENGEIHAFIAKGRPGCVSSCTVVNTNELKDFTRARYIRFRFQKFNIPKDKYSSLSDPSFLRRLFYSIKKISVGAQCICNGHATKCKRSFDLKSQCDCTHHTCGNNCEKCCSLYNQKPWKEGTASTVAVCEQCQCYGHAATCRYDAHVDAHNISLNIYGEYRGGGVCINCSKHTSGINCEKCENGWYRPSDIPPDADEPCLPCDCNPFGSTGICLTHDTEFTEGGKKAGTCTCLEGFEGIKCNKCALGYFNFPNCEKCECNSKGTDLSQSCEKQCVCKENIAGDMCDKCKSGYFDLSAKNPRGCTECYCSGISTVCSEAEGYRLSVIRNLTEWLISDASVSFLMFPTWDTEANVLIISDNEMQKNMNNYYWVAPSQYIGNKLSSYGLTLRVSIEWAVMRGDTSGKPIYNPDIIIVGNNGLRIFHGNKNYSDINKIMLSVRLFEKNWYRFNNNWQNSEYSYSPINHEEEVSRQDMLSVLSNIKHILLRAKFHTDQIECSLLDAELEIGIKENYENKNIVSGLEQCSCPAGYKGLSCEDCDYGYVRLRSDSTSNSSVCSLCDCNGHSQSCDFVSGQCDFCEHNTTGSKCERCQIGFYGNAEIGTATDCKICACPLIERTNNFSPTCILKDDSFDYYVCDKCPIGYNGKHCEMCSEGYFGNPLEIGSKCVPCDCGGNPCNTTTGQCLKCEGNTEGWFCKQCKAGFFGNADEKNCSNCDCDEHGSENITSCDKQTGQCLCKMNYVGRRCDRCLDGFGDFISGCLPCSCNMLGSENDICDTISGQCPCKKGIYGRLCSRCLDNFFGFESGSGCQSCNCHMIGSYDDSCDNFSGQCNCKENITGRTCNQCKEGYWNLDGNGCKLCECDRKGSISPFCDMVTGQCTCKFGVTGHQCDRCQHNFYGFSKFGCFECEKCRKPGHICDVNSGRCICPFLIEGSQCDRCVSGAWNYRQDIGCQECNCEKQGSKSYQCNRNTGQCDCGVGYSGVKCDICAPGFYGFPNCRPCSCNIAGSDPETCFNNYCLCDKKGQCYCKANTSGKKCDTCKEGTFGMHIDNVGGCTPCFCFGRSNQCSEAGLTWNHIKLRPDRTLIVSYDINNDTSSNFSSSDIFPVDTQEVCFINLALPNKIPEENKNFKTSTKLNVTNNLRLIPEYIGDVEIGVNYLFDAPIYWQLSDAFLGDKILSYGGFIEFTVDTQGEQTLLPPAVISSYPLIQIQGNGRFILEYFPPVITFEKHHRVRLHESLWKLKNNPTSHVSRDIFMLTLQNLQHILIRASKSIDFTKAILSDVSMDIAVKNEELLSQTTSVTHGIEVCECPSQYSSSSCQNPSVGYYRSYDNRTTTIATIIVQVIGEAALCNCNGLSSFCETNTGKCVNCSKNTGGDHCESCADGFYRTEFNQECKVCPCPSESYNHASTCYIPSSEQYNDNVTCYCKIGYTGKLCNRCNYGWYGYPKFKNGSCQPCKCNLYGSSSDECHEETGQCNCKTDTIGRDCSFCKKQNHVLSHKGCIFCEDVCVEILLNYVNTTIRNITLGTQLVIRMKFKPPWHLLNDINEHFIDVKNLFDSNLSSDLRLFSYGNTTEEDLKKKVRISINKIKRILKYIQNLKMSTNVLISNTSTSADISISILEEIKNIITNLEKYITSEKIDFNLPTVVSEARYLLNSIKELENVHQIEKAEKILSSCRITYENVRNYENNGPGLHLLKKKAEKLIERVEDLKFIISNTSSVLTQMYFHSNSSNKKLQWILNITQSISDILFDVEKIQRELRVYNDLSKRLIDKTKKNTHNIYFYFNNLKNLSRIVEEKEGILFDLNTRYKETYVIPAGKHAHLLLDRVKHYVNLFTDTKHDADIALKASGSYKNIVNISMNAKEVIGYAKRIIDSLSNKLHSKSGQNSVVDKAYSMEEMSRQLKTLAQIEAAGVERLQKQYEYQQRFVDFSESMLQEIMNNISSIFRQMTEINYTKDKLKYMNETLKKYKNSIELPDQVYDDIFWVHDNINDELKPKLNKIQNYGEISLRPDDELKIKETKESTEKIVLQLHSIRLLFSERSKYFEKWNSSISEQLLALRNKIEETKHLANGIHLSLSSKNDQELCTRSYQSKYLKPSITNYISITYAVATSHRDALLFYLASSVGSDFMAVEMINRKIRFVWDLGGGPAELIHPLHIQTAGDLQKDQHWYKIDIERIANLGKLSVRPVIVSSSSSSSFGFLITNFSTPGWNRFDVSSNDYIWVGGTNKPVNSILLSKQTGLIGCLDRLFFDNRPIGLWNFKAESVGSCTACIEGVEEIREDDSYFFTGDGYSVLHGHSSSVYNKFFFSVSFNFKTYDENSVLFYAVAGKPQQYITIIIKEGRIVFKIGYTENIKLEIKSSNRYLTGNWTRLEASRFYDRKKKTERGVLKVGSEVKENIPLPSVPHQNDIPDLSMPQYFFGGIPPSFKTMTIPSQSFLGCMSDLQVIQEAYNPLRGNFWGIQKSCSDKPLTVVGFKGNGYLELSSYPLRKSSSFSFVFSTNQPNSFLMLSTTEGFGISDIDEEINKNETDTFNKVVEVNYYSVSLREGRVELIVNAGNKDTRLISKIETNYSDGQLHSVTLLKTGKRLELRIDDGIQAIGFMEEVGSSIVQAAGTIGGLFFGGLPGDINLNISIVSQVPLIGTVRDAIFNDRLVQFNRPIEFEGALIGRLGPQLLSSEWDALAQNTEGGESNSCQKSKTYSLEPYAVQFGDMPGSHVRLDYVRQVFHNKNSSIELLFRTFYSDGILLIIPGADEKQNHYVRLFLYAGKIFIHVKGRKLFELQCETTYDDGKWHHVKIMREGRTLSIKVDNLPLQKEVIPKKLHLLNVIFVGGYPNKLSIFKTSLSKIEALKGCIKNIRVNGKAEDLVSERAKLHHVGQCFPRIEKGAYFSGDSYAIVSESYYIGRSLDFEAEFRTSELNGILMSISEPQGYPALSLELTRGKVILNGDMGDRRPFKIEQEFSSVYYLCDNEWHRVKIVFFEEEITIYVDDWRKMYWLSDNGHITEAHINAPLFIGGITKNAADITLENKDNFKGCIRNVKIGTRQMQWTEFYELHEVLFSSCPV